jgi:hypothetical protein
MIAGVRLPAHQGSTSVGAFLGAPGKQTGWRTLQARWRRGVGAPARGGGSTCGRRPAGSWRRALQVRAGATEDSGRRRRARGAQRVGRRPSPHAGWRRAGMESGATKCGQAPRVAQQQIPAHRAPTGRGRAREAARRRGGPVGRQEIPLAPVCALGPEYFMGRVGLACEPGRRGGGRPLRHQGYGLWGCCPWGGGAAGRRAGAGA